MSSDPSVPLVHPIPALAPLPGSNKAIATIITTPARIALPSSSASKTENGFGSRRAVTTVTQLEGVVVKRSDTERSAVELPGIEPGSPDPDVSLLRA